MLCRTYYRLGCHSPASGLRAHVSLSALNFHVMATMPTMMPAATKVLALQFPGWAYQPPEGDQTCLGYLLIRDVNMRDFSKFDRIEGAAGLRLIPAESSSKG